MVETDTSIHEEAGEYPVQNGGSDLALDIIPDDGQMLIGKTLAPVFRASNEYGDAIHHTAAGIQDLFHVPFGRHLRSNRQVIDDHIGLGILENFDNVGGGAGSFPAGRS